MYTVGAFDVHNKVREEDGELLCSATDVFNAFPTFPAQEYISRASG